ncbi:hypothetical protein [Pararhodonellum marinum]|uniref:hypothetical protein n=1 Tax=Pararhodonellum marinum TaxID=2755358 RepID=UPI0018906CC0|nr:hypothetical protein [Pararhodonellum marinum]
MKKQFTILLASIILFHFGCTSSSKIIGSWKSHDPNSDKYKNIFVYALIGDDFILKQTIEEDVDKILEEKGIYASSSLNVKVPAELSIEERKSFLAEKIYQSGHDAIMTIAIIDQTNETRYVPGTSYYNPMMYGGGYVRFGGYYSMYGPMMYSPGYYDTEKNFYAEINLYDSKDQNLIWSAQSKTTNPTQMQKDAYDFAEVVVKQMIKEEVIEVNK